MSIREDSLVARIASLQDFSSYRDLSWEGSFEEYLRVVRERPQVTRNAFQRSTT
jgi:serine protein kinase